MEVLDSSASESTNSYSNDSNSTMVSEFEPIDQSFIEEAKETQMLPKQMLLRVFDLSKDISYVKILSIRT
jgi:hypothetical protein